MTLERPALDPTTLAPHSSSSYPDVDLAYRPQPDGTAVFTHKSGEPYSR